jgi:3-oxoacyl-[acyl-carrier-protein] synthase-1
MKPLAITACTLVTALGDGCAATLDALANSHSGLVRGGFETCELDTWLGTVQGLEEAGAGAGLAEYDCRNNRLAARTLLADGFGARVRKLAERVGAGRVGLFLGSSNAGILSTEIAYRYRDASGALPAGLPYATTQNLYSPASYVRHALGLRGPAFVVSTACSSGAKVFASAARMLALGLIDAAVVGGVDTHCMTTLYGFHSLELVGSDICRPWDARRQGLSLGEGAAFALLEREPSTPALAWLLGAGESSDGHHMSAPHPEGAGAAMAMRQALVQAGMEPQAVDYINLHGTGTPNNDAAEDLAVCAVFGNGVPCSSTKGQTGHTLGAAGGVEAVITVLALQRGIVPAGLNVRQLDPTLHANYQLSVQRRPLAIAASNSFGFGGSNSCLIFGTASRPQR